MHLLLEINLITLVSALVNLGTNKHNPSFQKNKIGIFHNRIKLELNYSVPIESALLCRQMHDKQQTGAAYFYYGRNCNSRTSHQNIKVPIGPKKGNTLHGQPRYFFLQEDATFPQLGLQNHMGSVLSAQKSLRQSSDLPPETHAHGRQQQKKDLEVDLPAVCLDEWSPSSIGYHRCFSADYQFQQVSLEQALLTVRCRNPSTAV